MKEKSETRITNGYLKWTNKHWAPMILRISDGYLYLRAELEWVNMFGYGTIEGKGRTYRIIGDPGEEKP